MNIARVKSGLAIALLAGLAAACDEPARTLMSETKTVSLEGASRAEVGLNMSAGELRVRGADQEALLEAEFEFNRDRYRPEVDYRLFGEKGILAVRHSRRHGVPFGRVHNIWTLGLSRAVPIDLAVDLGAGQSDLDLRGLKLQRLDIDMGVGEMTLDLRGPHENGFRVKIDGGVGSGKIHLPAEVGVRVKVDGGLGSVDTRGLTKQSGYYLNEAYGRSPVSIEIDIDAGIGSLDIRVEPVGRIRT
jgi:hypothetical protein